MTQQQTAAERYASLKENQFEVFLEASFSKDALKGVELFEVKCPSGLVIKCRRLDANYATRANQMPMALSSQILPSGKPVDVLTPEAEEAENAKRFAAMSPTEQRSAIQASAQMVRYIAVEPRLVIGDVGDRTDAISVDVLTLADFSTLAKVAQGGDVAGGLKTFRRKRE